MVISYLYVLILAWIFINDSAPSLFFSKVCMPNNTKKTCKILHALSYCTASVFIRPKFLHPDLDILDSAEAERSRVQAGDSAICNPRYGGGVGCSVLAPDNQG